MNFKITPLALEIIKNHPEISAYGYKLLHVRKDNSLGPLFINRKQIIPLNEWMKAEPHRTKNYTFRPGWHICSKPYAPHIKLNHKYQKRAWYKVQFLTYKELLRPKSQGGLWYLAKYMRLIKKVRGR